MPDPSGRYPNLPANSEEAEALSRESRAEWKEPQHRLSKSTSLKEALSVRDAALKGVQAAGDRLSGDAEAVARACGALAAAGRLWEAPA